MSWILKGGIIPKFPSREKKDGIIRASHPSEKGGSQEGKSLSSKAGRKRGGSGRRARTFPAKLTRESQETLRRFSPRRRARESLERGTLDGEEPGQRCLGNRESIPAGEG